MTSLDIESINKPAKYLMVLLHGLGSDGHDLLELVPFLKPSLPDFYFYSPHGVQEFDMAPNSGWGRQWFSLQDRNPSVILPLIKNSVKQLEEIIIAKQKSLGLTNLETIIVGFSQGTMTGLYLNLIQNKSFKAIIGFSGRLIKPEEIINLITPVCLIHGTEDDVVEISALHQAHLILQNIGINCIKFELNNLRHSIDSRGIDLAINFIKNMIK